MQASLGLKRVPASRSKTFLNHRITHKFLIPHPLDSVLWRDSTSTGMDYLRKLMELEINGVEGKNPEGKDVRTWPVRYCADMLLSGHTFVTCPAKWHDHCSVVIQTQIHKSPPQDAFAKVLVLYMLAFADLMRRITIMMSPVPST